MTMPPYGGRYGVQYPCRTPRYGGVDMGVRTPRYGGVFAPCVPPFCTPFATTPPRVTVRRLPPMGCRYPPAEYTQPAPKHPSGDPNGSPNPRPNPTLYASLLHPYRRTPAPKHPSGDPNGSPNPRPNPTLYASRLHPYRRTPAPKRHDSPKSPAEATQSPCKSHPAAPPYARAKPALCARYARAGADPRRWHDLIQPHRH